MKYLDYIKSMISLLGYSREQSGDVSSVTQQRAQMIGAVLSNLAYRQEAMNTILKSWGYGNVDEIGPKTKSDAFGAMSRSIERVNGYVEQNRGKNNRVVKAWDDIDQGELVECLWQLKNDSNNMVFNDKGIKQITDLMLKSCGVSVNTDCLYSPDASAPDLSNPQSWSKLQAETVENGAVQFRPSKYESYLANLPQKFSIASEAIRTLDAIQNGREPEDDIDGYGYGNNPTDVTGGTNDVAGVNENPVNVVSDGETEYTFGGSNDSEYEDENEENNNYSGPATNSGETTVVNEPSTTDDVESSGTQGDSDTEPVNDDMELDLGDNEFDKPDDDIRGQNGQTGQVAEPISLGSFDEPEETESEPAAQSEAHAEETKAEETNTRETSETQAEQENTEAAEDDGDSFMYDPEIKSAVSRAMGIMKELYEPGFDLQKPAGLIIKTGLLYMTPGGKLKTQNSASYAKLYALVNEASGGYLVQSDIDHSRTKDKLRNLMYRQGTTYYPEYQLGNCLGLTQNGDLNSWVELSGVLTREVGHIMNKEVKGGRNRDDIVDALTTAIIVSELDLDSVIKLRISVAGNRVTPEKFRALYEEHKREILSGVGELYRCEAVGMGIIEVIILTDPKKYHNAPLFAYKAVEKLIQTGRTPSIRQTIMGQDQSGRIFTQNLLVPEACITLIGAGQRSGKGVLTLNLLGTILASGHPLIYLDCKPDMSVVIRQIAAKNGKQVACWDAMNSFGLPTGVGAPDGLPGVVCGSFGQIMYLKVLQLMMVLSMLAAKGTKLFDKAPFFIFDECLATQQFISSNWPMINDMTGEKEETPTKTWASTLLKWALSLQGELKGVINSQLPASGVRTVWLFQSVQPTTWSQQNVALMKKTFNPFMNVIMSNSSIKILGRNTFDSEYGLSYIKNNGEAKDLVDNNRWFALSHAKKINGMQDVKLFKPYLVLNEANSEAPCVQAFRNNIGDELFMQVTEGTGVLHPGAGLEGFIEMIGGDAIGNIDLGVGLLNTLMEYTGLSTKYSSIEDYIYSAGPDDFYSCDELINRRLLKNGAVESDVDREVAGDTRRDTSDGVRLGGYDFMQAEPIKRSNFDTPTPTHVGGTPLGETTAQTQGGQAMPGQNGPVTQSQGGQTQGQPQGQPQPGNGHFWQDVFNESQRGNEQGGNAGQPQQTQGQTQGPVRGGAAQPKNQGETWQPQVTTGVDQNGQQTVTMSMEDLYRLLNNPRPSAPMSGIDQEGFARLTTDNNPYAQPLQSGMYIDCTGAARVKQGVFTKFLASSPGRASVIFDKMFESILKEAVKQTRKRGIITRASFVGDNMTLNDIPVDLNGVVGGTWDCRLQDIFDVRILFKKIPTLRTLQLDTDMLSIALMNAGSPEASALFDLCGSLGTLVIIRNGASETITRGNVYNSRMVADSKKKSDTQAIYDGYRRRTFGEIYKSKNKEGTRYFKGKADRSFEYAKQALGGEKMKPIRGVATFAFGLAATATGFAIWHGKNFVSTLGTLWNSSK